MTEQRWNERRSRFVTPSHRFDPKGFLVIETDSDTLARRFVEEHHYSGSYPAARFRFCLYRRNDLVGTAVFSHPCNNATLDQRVPDGACAPGRRARPLHPPRGGRLQR
ncbi:MAG TPA: hypothetical protein VF183_07270 [Acidimicrobiales bacterium]